ncbi:hypothetical protein [Actinomadura rudentiformis]|uniref:Uncharacterized protein n=1 Tax=Actinomadura rudentiformis TaxID=359158 RepID=A0A6H9Z797_9ACTN|nr:hypothetical protein [Actinomadura rudentiformis]KAB2350858.1 hypothetical protein F8566_07810 [Actinomadura rudentiformis]
MAHDPARSRTVSVLLRRVVGSRLVHRLLVLAGIAVTCWLTGAAAEAHAEDHPASRIVAQTPVVSGIPPVKEAAAPREATAADAAVRDAAKGAMAVPAKDVGGTAETVLRPKDLNATRPDLPLPVPSPGLAGGVGNDVVGSATTAQSVTHDSSRASEHAADAMYSDRQGPLAPHATGTSKNAPKASPAVSYAKVSHPEPAPAPISPLNALAKAGTAGPASGVGLLAGLGGLLGRWSWTVARPRPVLMPAFGAVPPAVRTAADEPTFSPD